MLIDALQANKKHVIDLSISALGVLSTLACFVPKNSKLGKLINFFTKHIIALKSKIIKK
jgi:hypothetical protein